MSEEQGGNNVPHSNGKEERIYVAIRVRPLNEREKTRQDVSEWECVSHNTIKFKNNGHAEQRSSPDTYTFGNKHVHYVHVFVVVVIYETFPYINVVVVVVVIIIIIIICVKPSVVKGQQATRMILFFEFLLIFY